MITPALLALSLWILESPIERPDEPPPKPALESIVSDRPIDYPMKIAVHPIRQVGTNRVDLTPLFAWMRHVWANDGRTRTLNPMPYWKPLGMQVAQVEKWGVVGDLFKYTQTPAGYEKMHRGTVVLRNWPTDGISEGDNILVLAIDIGPGKFRDASGEVRTLRVFDAGVPIASAKK